MPDLDEFVRTYSRPHAWGAASGLYQSMLKDGPEIQKLAEAHPLTMPVLAVGAGGGPLTEKTMTAVSSTPITSVTLEGVGHFPAIEAPEKLSAELLRFWEEVDLAGNGS